MSDTTNPVNDMTRGTVQGINETGGINVIFDDQSIATVIPGVDNFRPLTVEEAIAEAIPFDRNLDIDELSNQIITFYRDFDPYDFDDIYSGEDPSKPFNDVKGYVQDVDEITALRSYFKEKILPEIIQQ